MKVNRTLGPGFLESVLEAVYEEALGKEFQNQKIPFKKQVNLELYYENQKLKKQYRTDFVCFDSIIIGNKSCYTNTCRILCSIKKLFKMYKYGIRNVD